MTMRRTPTVLTLALLLCLAIAMPAAGAEDDGARTRTNVPCGFAWLDTDLQNIILLGTGTVVVRPQANSFTLRCKLTLPEGDPTIASFETVCGAVGDYCVNGVAIVGFDLLGCQVEDGRYTTDDTLAFVSSGGQYTFLCQGTLDGG